jgi:hypothetical protein
MATDEKMNIDEKYKYIRIKKSSYVQAKKRKEKSAILDELQEVTGYHRKHLLNLLKQAKLERSQHHSKRSASYGPEVATVLATIWEAQDKICADRLHGILIHTAEQLARHGEISLSASLKQQLEKISVSTIRRLLPKGNSPKAQRARARKRLHNAHQQAIPVRTIPWDIKEPGHFELDLVHHCGGRLEGEYVYTLQIVDVATGWSGRRAILGRSYVVIADALYYLINHLPFPILELHPDNGSEFLNANLLRFLHKHSPHLDWSRSAPGKPNQNRNVEQKNSSLVRAFLDDIRLDTVTQTRYLNSIYDQMHTYHNFIQPVMHQIEKKWVSNENGSGGYTRRKYDTPVPPVVRLCKSGILSLGHCVDLLAQRDAINPLALLRKIHADLQHLYQYDCAKPGETQDIYQTLAYPELFPQALTALGETENPDPFTITKEVDLAVR